MAGGKGHERRAAERSGDVGTRVESARLGEFVEVGRANVLVAHEGVVGPGLIVREDHDDVRAIRSGCGGDGYEAEGC